MRHKFHLYFLAGLPSLPMPDPIPAEVQGLTRQKRARSMARIQMSTESTTGIGHQFVTPAQHSEGGDTYIEQQSTSKETLTPGKFSFMVVAVGDHKYS